MKKMSFAIYVKRAVYYVPPTGKRGCGGGGGGGWRESKENSPAIKEKTNHNEC